MMSIFPSRRESSSFSLRWRGYDRAEVDEFMRRTAADRQRLHEDLAQLEAVMAGRGADGRQEVERLTALQAEVAHCIESSLDALRKASVLVASAGASGPAAEAARSSIAGPAADPRVTALDTTPPVPPFRWAPARRTVTLAAAALALVLSIAAASYYQAFRNQSGADKPAVSATAAPGAVEPTAPPEPALRLGLARMPEHVAASEPDGLPGLNPGPETGAVSAADDLVGLLLLTLTARDSCWIRTSIDGGEPVDRLLQPNETIVLRATDEAVLRIGDAAALSLVINNHQTRPLGGPGQVVTKRITRSNYRDLVSNE